LSASRRTEPARARSAAYEILLRVERAGAWASALLEQREAHLFDRRDAALLHESVLGVLRRRRVLDHAIRHSSGRGVEQLDVEVRTSLRLGAYALLFLDRVPAHAAVDDAVELVKRGPRRAAASLVNAVLRKVAREGTAALPAPPRKGDVEALALYRSHPDWWVRRAVDRYGWEGATALLERQNRPARTTLRAHRRRGDVESLLETLRREGCEARPGSYATAAVRVESGGVARSSALREGACWVQDEAAQLVGDMLAACPGAEVIDLCAAPGGKTLQLADGLDGSGTVVAVDRHHGRLRRLARAASRVGAGEVLPLLADSTREAPFRSRFSRVLLDAPCSGSGTQRRRPEIRWKLRESDLAMLAARQSRLLNRAAALTAPGGTLVYSVCSTEPEEGEDVVRRFLESERAFRCADPTTLLPPPARELVGPDGFVRTSPLNDGIDGFFVAVLRRGSTVP